MHILLALQTAFSLWMLVDAIKRGSEYYWWIIIMVPFGEWVYFFAVYLDSSEYRMLKKRLLSRSPGITQLEYNARTSPSVNNKLLLAQGLHDKNKYTESCRLFGEVLGMDKHNKEALHGLGLCLAKLGEKQSAIERFEELVNLDLAYGDFSASEELASLYWETGDKESSLDLMKRVAQKSKRISHMTMLGQYLTEFKDHDSAKRVLNEVVDDYENSPGYVRRMNRRWIGRARTLLRSLR
jgi:hypothetical protein